MFLWHIEEMRLNVCIANKYIVYNADLQTLYAYWYVNTINRNQRIILLKQNGNKKEPCSIFFIRIDFFIAIIRQVTKERERKRERERERARKLLLTKRIAPYCNMLPSIFSLTAKPTNNLFRYLPDPWWHFIYFNSNQYVFPITAFIAANWLYMEWCHICTEIHI